MMIQNKNEQEKNSVTLNLEKKTDMHVILTNFFLVQILKSSSFEYFESRKKRTCDSCRQQKATSAFQPTQGSEAEKAKEKINLSLKNTLQNNKNCWANR
jgi:hypothetical protein